MDQIERRLNTLLIITITTIIALSFAIGYQNVKHIEEMNKLWEEIDD